MSTATELESFEETGEETGKEIVPAEKVVDAEVVDKKEPAQIDISSLTDEQKAEVGTNIQTEIIEDGRHVMARYLRIGKNLYFVAKYHLYKQLGADTFDEWRAQPELQLSRSTSYALMKVFEVFIEKFKIDHDRIAALDWTKLYNISSLCTAENVDEMLTKVETLSRADLQREISETKARLAGKTQSQATAHVADLDFVRECCPIGCGTTCPVIKQDEDAAVVAFKKFLGKWKSISARIEGLFGGKKADKSQDDSKPSEKKEESAEMPPLEEAPASDGTSQDATGFEEASADDLLPSNGNPPADERGEPHVQERATADGGGESVHGENADAGSEGVEGSDKAPDEKQNSVWPT